MLVEGVEGDATGSFRLGECQVGTEHLMGCDGVVVGVSTYMLEIMMSGMFPRRQIKRTSDESWSEMRSFCKIKLMLSQKKKIT